MALAQHFGLPTRLLDWSYSALIALWFAVKDTPVINAKGSIENGVVWVFVPTVDDYKNEHTDSNPFIENSVTKIFRPRIISTRISSQSGVFTIHKLNKGNHFIALEKNKKYSEKLIKIIIPFATFPRIRHRLNILGINCSNVFPDLGGLCSYITWRYSYSGDEKILKN